MVLATAAVTAACVVRGLEGQLLEQFFAASRLYDRAGLSRIATVVFNPASDGIIQDFSITRIERTGNASDARVVTIEAPVRQADGQMVPGVLAATIEQREGRWMVTALRRLPASRTSP